jgi:hypothetical protein
MHIPRDLQAAPIRRGKEIFIAYFTKLWSSKSLTGVSLQYK